MSVVWDEGNLPHRSLIVLNLWTQLSPLLTAKDSSGLSLRGDTTLKSCAVWVWSSALLKILVSHFSLNNSTQAFSWQSVVKEEAKLSRTWYTWLPWAQGGTQVEKGTEKFPLSKCFTVLLGYFTITPRRQPKDQATPHRPIAYRSWLAIHGLVVTVLSILPSGADREDQALSQQGTFRTLMLLAASQEQ